MKTCSKCRLPKPDVEFKTRNGKRSSGYCKSCLYIYQSTRWNRKKAILVKYKGEKCEKCGRHGHPSIFDFHHRDPNKKDFAIGNMRRLSITKLFKEADKCDLLCACCHRLQHINPQCWDFENPNFRQAKVRLCHCGAIIKRGKLCVTCSARAREVIEWPENLPDLVVVSSLKAVAQSLGVSDKAVAKRLRNHHQRPKQDSNLQPSA